MARIAQLMVDKTKMEKGVFKEYFPFSGVKVQLRIASSNNPAYNEEVQKIVKEHLKEIREDTTGRIEGQLLRPAVARHLLLGWENIEDDQGKPLPYSFEAALGLFEMEELQHLYNWVRIQAEIIANFRKEEFKESEKNL